MCLIDFTKAYDSVDQTLLWTVQVARFLCATENARCHPPIS